MVRFGLAVIGGSTLIVAAIWVCVHAAGTPWVFPILAVLFGAVFWLDWFNERRPSTLTPLERFERRETERRSAA